MSPPRRGPVIVALAALLCGSCLPGGNVRSLQGSGATFPAPLYKRWFLEYYRRHPDVQVNYQAIGSGAGIRQFTEGLVDFGASDAAMSDDEIGKVERGVLLLPMTAGSVVICYNVPGLTGQLRLSRDTYVKLFLGRIDNWDDDALRRDNPGADLPSLPVTVIRRAEGSGTTFAFTNHLGAVSAEWRDGPGVGKSVAWPRGIGARGNAGVAALIQQTPGAVGYLEFGYAELCGLPTAVLENKAGRFVTASPESGRAALAGAAVPDNLRIFVADPAGPDAYPIVTYTWLLCPRRCRDRERLETLRDVLRYCLTEGQQLAGELGYVPLPDDIVRRGVRAVDQITAE